jgi:hypothetical protein
VVPIRGTLSGARPSPQAVISGNGAQEEGGANSGDDAGGSPETSPTSVSDGVLSSLLSDLEILKEPGAAGAGGGPLAIASAEISINLKNPLYEAQSCTLGTVCAAEPAGATYPSPAWGTTRASWHFNPLQQPPLAVRRCLVIMTATGSSFLWPSNWVQIFHSVRHIRPSLYRSFQ